MFSWAGYDNNMPETGACKISNLKEGYLAKNADNTPRDDASFIINPL